LKGHLQKSSASGAKRGEALLVNNATTDATLLACDRISSECLQQTTLTSESKGQGTGLESCEIKGIVEKNNSFPGRREEIDKGPSGENRLGS